MSNSDWGDVENWLHRARKAETGLRELKRAVRDLLAAVDRCYEPSEPGEAGRLWRERHDAIEALRRTMADLEAQR